MFKKFLLFSMVSLTLSAGIAQAACEGKDLLAALPQAERQVLIDRAEKHPFPKGNYYRASRKGEVIHLLGTMHLPDPRHDAILQKVTPELSQAKVVLVEASPENETRLKAEIVKRPEFMFITEGPKLNKLLPEADWKVLAERMQAQGVPPLVTSRFRPWYLAVTLGITPCLLETIKSGAKGLDHQIMEKAAEAQIPIESLEPYDTLFTLFGGLTMEEELEMVRAALLASSNPEDTMATTINAYFRGETQLLWEFTLEQALSDPQQDPTQVRDQFALMEDVMMAKRNKAWIPILTKAAKRGPTFAAFGALHLPGENGVLALLEAEGFRVEAMK